MQRTHTDQGAMPSDSQIMARRQLNREARPTREDMLRFYRGDLLKPSMDTVCKGNCMYCDGDGGLA